MGIVPANEYCPGIQSTMPVPSVLGHFFPAGHLVHVVFSPTAYVPEGQNISRAVLDKEIKHPVIQIILWLGIMSNGSFYLRFSVGFLK